MSSSLCSPQDFMATSQFENFFFGPRKTRLKTHARTRLVKNRNVFAHTQKIEAQILHLETRSLCYRTMYLSNRYYSISMQQCTKEEHVVLCLSEKSASYNIHALRKYNFRINNCTPGKKLCFEDSFFYSIFYRVERSSSVQNEMQSALGTFSKSIFLLRRLFSTHGWRMSHYQSWQSTKSWR